jgi:hypothetical protein
MISEFRSQYRKITLLMLMVFEYPSFGAGTQPFLGSVVLAQGTEAMTASRAIIDSVQLLQHSIVEPPLQAGGAILAGQTWSTDTVEIDPKLVTEHNQAFPAMALPTDRQYGIKYSGTYVIENKQLAFKLQSFIYQRGTQSAFRPYDGPYSGAFFGQRLEKVIQGRLSTAVG